MKKLLLFTVLLISAVVFAQDITGKWNGILQFPAGKLRITVDVSKTGTGYQALMGSPDQGPGTIPADSFTFENNTVTFAIVSVMASYTGTYNNGLIKGTFTQRGMEIPLELTRGEVKIEEHAKPQDPKKPYPYYTEDITFKNDKADIILAGTLTLPKKEGNYPAVILISGSGQQNRDEEILGHKPFLVLADHLTKNGFAVLRYDDRGAGKSGGKFATATTADFTTDAEAAFNYLKTRPEINKKKIGFIGHSEGGMIAPMVAVNNADVAFIILMAGPGITGSELMVLQNYLIGKADGIPEDELTKLSGINKRIYDAISSENDPKKMEEAVRTTISSEMGSFFASKGVPQSEIDNYINAQVEGLTSPWYVYLIKYDPAPVLEKVKCPILALNGDKDVQVAANANLDGIKRAAEKGGNKKVTTKKMQGLNHLFQECTTGQAEEYSEIQQTLSPALLDEITNWMKKEAR